MKSSNSSRKKGLSLIAVLWMVTILTVMASEFMYSMQLAIRSSRNWTDQVNAIYAAKGGMELAIAQLRLDNNEYDSLDEDWAQTIQGELNNCRFEAVVIDESTKININTADQNIIARLIEYCLVNTPSNEELSESERQAKAQELASAIVQNRPYRTPAEVAKVDGMTPELLYGYTGDTTNTETTESYYDESEEGEEQKIVPLIEMITVYSVDKNISSDGNKRVNINTADANQIQQGVNPQGQQIITQQEAQAIVDYRNELGQQSAGGQQGQTAQPATGGQQGQAPTGGQQGQNRFTSIAQLLDVPAISQQTLDSIRDRITVSDQDQGGNQQGQQRRININTASAQELMSLSNNIDQGIADSIIRYRQNRQFTNVDELRQVKAISLEDLKVIVDRVTLTDSETVQGKININTAPVEILRLLPGMDEQKANAIAERRKTDTSSTGTSVQGSNQGPFTSIGQILDLQGFDENTFRQLVDMITYRSYSFRIQSVGRSLDEKISQTCISVIDKSGNNIVLRYYKQT